MKQRKLEKKRPVKLVSDIILKIEKRCVKNECNDTNTKKLTNNCPICSIERTYKYKQNRDKFLTKPCRSCAKSTSGLTNVGDKIGHWFVMNPIPKLIQYDQNRYRRLILVRCDCGTERWLNASVLRSGASKSCGCSTYGQGAANSHWSGTSHISGTFFGKLEHGAKYRKKKFTLTIEQLEELYVKQDGKCALSGLPIRIALTKAEDTTASVDRIDSNKGYIIDNVQWVHKSVNLMKQSLTDSDFISLCEHVVNFRRK